MNSPVGLNVVGNGIKRFGEEATQSPSTAIGRRFPGPLPLLGTASERCYYWLSKRVVNPMAIVQTTGTLAPTFSPLLHRYTLEEFWALPEPEGRAHYELIGGNLFMVPPPDPPHGDVDAYLNTSLANFLNANGSPGRIYHPREPIYVDDTYVEPDMMYVSNELREKMGKRRTSANIVFEYLSKSTANYDRTTKADTYLALGVMELWLLDSDAKTIETRNRADREGFPVWESRRFVQGETASSRVLAGWEVSVTSLFAGL